MTTESKSSNGCPHECAHCNSDTFRAGRLDYWYSAKAALQAHDAGWAGDYTPDPQDVLVLAIFLAAENSPI